ncbi:hypothetical protein Droror1_Dr00014260 [Drosera rotundifolia]
MNSEFVHKIDDYMFVQGKVLQDHPPIKLLISIAGSTKPSIADVAYKETNKVKSVHFIGAKDWLRIPSEDFAIAFEDPVLIRHPQGHTVPRLDEAAVEQLKNVVKALVEPSKKFMEDKDAKESDEAHLGEEDKPQDVLGNWKQEEAALDIKIGKSKQHKDVLDHHDIRIVLDMNTDHVSSSA